MGTFPPITSHRTTMSVLSRMTERSGPILITSSLNRWCSFNIFYPHIFSQRRRHDGAEIAVDMYDRTNSKVRCYDHSAHEHGPVCSGLPYSKPIEIQYREVQGFSLGVWSRSPSFRMSCGADCLLMTLLSGLSDDICPYTSSNTAPCLFPSAFSQPSA